MSTTYTHKGITITFNALAARFEAAVGEKPLAARSLDAIKKQIDAALAVKFEPFKALRFWADELVAVTVTNVQKETSGYRRGELVFNMEWQSKGSSMKSATTERFVTPDTPENREQIKAWQKAHKEGHAEMQRIKNRIDEMHRAIPRVEAEDYGVGK